MSTLKVMPGVLSLVGVIALAWVQANEHIRLNNVCTNVCHITYFT